MEIFIVIKCVEYEESVILAVKSTEELAIKAAEEQLSKEDSELSFNHNQFNREGLNLIHEWECSNRLFAIEIQKWVVE
jgi:PIN domain nuclease of toxin-antitoxin system